MSTRASSKLLTAEEFYEIADRIDADRMELIDGEVITLLPVSGKHGTRTVKIASRLLDFAEAHNLGEVGVEIGFVLSRSPDSVPAPNAAFVKRELMPPGGLPERGWVPYAPTLAVEVASPSETQRDIQAKTELYLAAGVERVWLVQPKTRTVTVFSGSSERLLQLGDTLTSEDAGFDVPGFELPLADLFE